MKRICQLICILIMFTCFQSVCALDCYDIRPPDGSTSPDFTNSSIAWRPQGDYAILVSTHVYYPSAVGIHKYDYLTDTLTYQDYVYPDYHFERLEFSSDGTFAIITGGEHVYRYDHSASGFGTITEIMDIENPGSCTITFFDVLRHPTSALEPMVILANLECGSSNQVKVLRYDPMASPQIYADESGGVSPMDSSAFEPWSGAWQADGDYLVWGTRAANGWHGRIFVWDPDHSTFPPNVVTDEMLDFPDSTLTNISTVCMSPSPGARFVMVKGTGRVVRYVEYPTTLVPDYPAGYHQSISEGDSSFNAAGTKCIILEQQDHVPCHEVMTFDADGDVISINDSLCGPGFTNQTGVRITAVEWHPTQQAGLMAGWNRWIFRFEDDPIPTPITPTPTTTVTPSFTVTPSPVLPIPSAGPSGLILLLAVMGLFIGLKRK